MACTESLPVEPTGRATLLIGVIVAGNDSVFVRFGSTSGLADLSPEPAAQLRIEREGETIPLEALPSHACGEPPGLACYAAHLPAPARAGQTVRIRGTFGDGHRIEGEAIVPEPPPIALADWPGDTARLASPDERVQLIGLGNAPFRVGMAELTVGATVWSHGRAAECTVSLPGPPPGFDLRGFPRVSLGVGPPACDGAPASDRDSMAVRIPILGYDANFTAWGDAGFLIAEVDGAWGVTGVRGVFGAAAARTFVLVTTLASRAEKVDIRP